MIAIDRILRPVDFSEPSARALEYALALAERLGAEVDVVHVFQFPTFAVEDDAVALLPLHLQENLSQRLRERLEQLVIEKAGEGPKITVEVLEGVPTSRSWRPPKGGLSSSWGPMGALACRTSCWGVWRSGWCAVPRCRCSPSARRARLDALMERDLPSVATVLSNCSNYFCTVLRAGRTEATGQAGRICTLRVRSREARPKAGLFNCGTARDRVYGGGETTQNEAAMRRRCRRRGV